MFKIAYCNLYWYGLKIVLYCTLDYISFQLAHLSTLENKTGKSSRAEPAKKQQPSVTDFIESSTKKVVHSNTSSSKATETANSSEMATGKGNKQNNPRKRKNCTTNNTEPFIV